MKTCLIKYDIGKSVKVINMIFLCKKVENTTELNILNYVYDNYSKLGYLLQDYKTIYFKSIKVFVKFYCSIKLL